MNTYLFFLEPLFFLLLTLAVYWLSLRVQAFGNGSALLNPVMVSVIILIVFLQKTETTYVEYFEGTQFIHFLLGPAVVLMAVPCYRYLGKAKEIYGTLFLALFFGSISTLAIVTLCKFWLGISVSSSLSMLPKSVTTPVALEIAQKIGGEPELTSAFVILTGVFASVAGPILLTLFNIKDAKSKGFAMGMAGHGIGTARAFQQNPVSGAFASLAMILNALLSSLIIPLVYLYL